ncbi:TIGR04255 family protein [Streptomyces sp. NPDC001581]|uniref:TIGR04255 family protein n=1 Tax=Streptomyces sp. NPDC001581 TaxID=3154386 RepID=UPI00331F6B5A
MDREERGPIFENLVVADVPLNPAPLARVIGQLRFGTLSVLASGDDAAQAYMKALSEEYPFVEQGVEQALRFTAGQPVQHTEIGKLWRLRSHDRQTLVALNNGALTLETTDYLGRTSFCDELARLAGIFQDITRVPAYNRVAVRYTNRIQGPETLARLTKLVHPELLGLVGVDTGPDVELTYTLSQAQFSFGEARNLMVQYGRLPGGATFDPTIDAVPEPNWVLDLDSYQEFPDARSGLNANPQSVKAAAVACAERAHAFFRWAVTEEFLTHFGGHP